MTPATLLESGLVIDGTAAIGWIGDALNTRAFWSLETARRVLDSSSEDDTEVVFADDVRRLLMECGYGSGGRLGTAGDRKPTGFLQ